MNAIRHNLARLLDFGGRQGRGLFWPYAGAIVVIVFLLIGVVMNVFVIPLLLAYQPGDRPNVLGAMGPFALTVLAAVALLAAAVVRRLHDRGLSGWWALPTPILLMSGVVGMGVLLDTILTNPSAESDPPLALFGLLFINNIAYLATLAGLAFTLSLPGRPEANRYGSSKP